MKPHITIELKEVYGAGEKGRLAILPYRQDDIEAHDHTFFELVYITEGYAVHTLNGKKGELQAGDYFIVDYGSIHSYSQSRGLALINCLFLPEIIDETLQGCHSFEELMHSCLIRYYRLAPGKALSNRIFHDGGGDIKRLVEGMQKEYEGRQAGYQEVIRGRLLEILILTLRTMIEEPGMTAVSSLVTEVIAYINSHYAESRVLGGYCDKFHFNSQYISRRFRKETGFTVMEYLQKVRIEKSCELLAGSELRVSEIAQLAGYSDVKHFEMLFSRMLHMSPREYRRMVQ